MKAAAGTRRSPLPRGSLWLAARCGAAACVRRWRARPCCRHAGGVRARGPPNGGGRGCPRRGRASCVPHGAPVSGVSGGHSGQQAWPTPPQVRALRPGISRGCAAALPTSAASVAMPSRARGRALWRALPRRNPMPGGCCALAAAARPLGRSSPGLAPAMPAGTGDTAPSWEGAGPDGEFACSSCSWVGCRSVGPRLTPCDETSARSRRSVWGHTCVLNYGISGGVHVPVVGCRTRFQGLCGLCCNPTGLPRPRGANS